MYQVKEGILKFFVTHKVAANVTMILMFLFGAIGILKLNVQFFPSFTIETVVVRTVWPSANAEDVKSAITIPIENKLQGLTGIKDLTSTSAYGTSVITITYYEGTNMIDAMEKLKQRVEQTNNLPSDAEKSTVERVEMNDSVIKCC